MSHKLKEISVHGEEKQCMGLLVAWTLNSFTYKAERLREGCRILRCLFLSFFSPLYFNSIISVQAGGSMAMLATVGLGRAEIPRRHCECIGSGIQQL